MILLTCRKKKADTTSLDGQIPLQPDEIEAIDHDGIDEILADMYIFQRQKFSFALSDYINYES